ncbi:hypothetical protein [Fictibacillus gelatini]|uniref:hypothetical protein n=1 Tax=Fictibacillus gelatini TaxID=225985 RepID=UPI00040C3D91|nr:hypothetical protein [Fictibacillus gelatini]
MTLKESLINAEGNINMIVGGYMPGETTQDFFDNVFGEFADKELPLTNDDFQALLDSTQSIGWKLNFHALRYEGKI